jgi:hypothetical protein
MKKIFFLASLISLACISCKAKKALNPEATASNTLTNETDNTTTYKLIVSFISKGAGTDGAKRTAFISYVEAHTQKPKFKTVLWGREGEADYCFTLSEFKNKKDASQFLEDIKKLALGSDLVLITENAKCLHKGR